MTNNQKLQVAAAFQRLAASTADLYAASRSLQETQDHAREIIAKHKGQMK